MELDLLVWIAVASSKLLILCPQRIQLRFKLPIGFCKLLERLDDLSHLVLSLLHLLLQELVALRVLVQLSPLLLIVELHLFYRALHVLHLPKKGLLVRLRLLG